ncbi:sigma-70 family RNA polymerase sigma factor [Virgibacillus ndiopensis]|uniref:sigma-70 family RNA polymerase sigma factor n=1 Tax=Virgibacillus ndiopensis TaxID=2004408 RepID=UPI000C06B230|nr:sigma-70 family RNA polymerase sigma factor [Virgibacillus ndiopensis]
MNDYRDNSIQLNKDKYYKTDVDKENLINGLMNDYSQKVYLLAYSYVKDHGLAEDVAQEVFIKCYRHIGKYRGEASISSWIYRITANTSKDFLRKKKFMNLIYPRQFFEDFRRSESSEEIFLKQNRKEQVLQTIFTLPIKYREILVLYYFQELTLEEIVKALNINSNTVRTRLSRGRDRLKQKLSFVEGE